MMACTPRRLATSRDKFRKNLNLVQEIWNAFGFALHFSWFSFELSADLSAVALWHDDVHAQTFSNKPKRI